MTSMVESRRFEEDSAFGVTGFEAVDMKQLVNKISRPTRLRIGLPVGSDNETKGTLFFLKKKKKKKNADVLLLSYLPKPTPSSWTSATGLGGQEVFGRCQR
jgi:hypothetical protein